MEKSKKSPLQKKVSPSKAEFVRPPNTLKAKVGSGGLADDILDKAQKLLENNSVDFLPLAEIYLANLLRAAEQAKHASDDNSNVKRINQMVYPAMQLKANGGMFHYPLITTTAGKLVHFLEIIKEPDEDVLDIVHAFHTTMRAIMMGKVTGDGGAHGKELLKALDDACERYFDRHPMNNKNTEYEDLESEITLTE